MSDGSETPEERQRVKLERLELALRASNEGIWDWETLSREIFYSRRILGLLKCAKDHAPNLFLPPFEHLWPEVRQLIDHVLLEIYFKDLESNFSMANQGMVEWMSLEKSSDLTGKHDQNFFAIDHWKPAEDDDKGIIQTGEAIIDQLELETWREGDENY